jgi:hypothetical protein
LFNIIDVSVRDKWYMENKLLYTFKKIPKMAGNVFLLQNDQIAVGYRQPLIEWIPCVLTGGKATGS